MAPSIAPESSSPEIQRGAAPAASRIHWIAPTCALASLLISAPAFAQVLTIDTNGNGQVVTNAPVDRQYRQVQPTHVALSTAPMDTRDKLEVIRIMQAEQGFAMRPLPCGHKGLTLEANGKLEPAGEAYLNMVTANGISAKPGARVVITDVKTDHNKLILDFNNGPDARHRFLRHISLGTDPYYDAPVVAGGGEPGGARITLEFKGHIPELTGDQVKALLAPLVSFDVKTPVQAYTDTLPKPLKEAILNHQVLVGMNTDMVMFAKGQPQTKYHTMDGQMPIDIWLYGQAPNPVTFVRINGNRVIRVEVARVGEPIQVFTRDMVAPMMTAAGEPTVEQAENVHVIQEGDVQRDPNKEMPAPPPTLRNPGEKLPTDTDKNTEVMRPVIFPKAQPDPDQPAAAPSGPPAGQSTPASTAGGTAPTAQAGAPATAQPGSAQAKQPGASPQPVEIGTNPDDQPH